MKPKCTGLDSSTRTFLVASLAFGLTTATAWTSYAGQPPTPTATATATATPTSTPTPPCDLACTLDKKCSVGGNPWRDACTVNPGEEVTYHYLVNLFGGGALVEVEDDKLGVIGQSSGQTLTRTATITETTTNTASMSLIAVDPGCICLVWEPYDSVTVTVVSPTPTPTAMVTPTASAEPTPTPMSCSESWPEVQIVTTAKGQSPTNNAKVIHSITGHIIDPSSLGDTAHRIPVCAGTGVTSRVSDSTGTPTNSAGGSLVCSPTECSGTVDVTEKYQSVSADGRDKDSITFLPK